MFYYYLCAAVTLRFFRGGMFEGTGHIVRSAGECSICNVAQPFADFAGNW